MGESNGYKINIKLSSLFICITFVLKYASNNCVSHHTVKKLYELNCCLIADKQEDDFEQGCGKSR
ncbi:hypothetical protein RIVM261_059530 [Rivularia sp. IAM M-261]|nr:hypothetical protein CAL7716_034930 [Calothrix sp. PCC 7716]GJD20997.1 hypothetical protein RIVM261_059530 [Rivularia sp. IAM M-261]